MNNGNPFGLNYHQLRLDTQRLVIRPIKENDCAEWLRVRKENYDYLKPWEPIWDMDHLTYIGFNRFVRDVQAGFQTGNYYGFVMYERSSSKLVGHIEVGNVLFWPKQSATIGYWVDNAKQGRGYMTETIGAVCRWAFDTLNLVKIEAGTLKHNHGSQRVLIKSGFHQEGISHHYGEIDGKFEDHILWGITKHELQTVQKKQLKAV